jgi:hypothetical protein
MRLVNRLVCIGLLSLVVTTAGWTQPDLGKFDAKLLSGNWEQDIPVILPAWEGSSNEGYRLREAQGLTVNRLCPEQNLYNLIADNPHLDPNLIYRWLYPHPEIKPKFLRPAHERAGDAMLSGRVDAPNVYAGVRKRFRWKFSGATGLENLQELQEEVLWVWKPEGWGFVAETYCATARLNDRYKAVLLWQQPEESRRIRYRVACLDAERGERWMAPLPVWEAVEHLETVTGKQIARLWEKHEEEYRRLRFWLSVTRDGSRTLVVACAFDYDWEHSLLFVYDGEGRLLRTRALPAYCNGIGRGFADNLFRLGLAKKPSGSAVLTTARLLVDREGNVLGRFARKLGEELPPLVHLDSDEIAWDSRSTAYYCLPKPGSRTH